MAWSLPARSTRGSIFSIKMVVMVLTAVGSLWLLATNYSSFLLKSDTTGTHSEPTIHVDVPQNPPEQPPTPPPVEHHPVPVVLRTVPTNQAGLGSVIAQLRSSAAIATMLGASFATFPVMSTHLTQYRAASLMRLDRLETPLSASSNICSVAQSQHSARAMQLVESWCGSGDTALRETQARELKGYFKDCGLILDDRPWDVRYDMSKCTWKWVKHVFSNIGLKEPRRGIGLHIRWGDMSVGTPDSDPLRPERSTPVDVAAQLLRKMRECGVQDELRVYMEWHNDTMLGGLGEQYHVVDTGDSVDDLLDLAANRIMILDISSYTVLAHQITAGGITIVPDIDLFGINWHDNGPNHVLRWHELLSIECSRFSALLSTP